MRRPARVPLYLGVVLALVTGSSAWAHPSGGGDRDAISYEELFPGEGVAHEKQHSGDGGHLPGRVENVDLVGQVTVTPRTDGGGPPPPPDPGQPPPAQDAGPLTGRIADVGAFGDHAYLAAFREPTCEEGGVFVVDISDPTSPVELEDAFIPAAEGNFVGEGVQVVDVVSETFTGQVLIHNNEICDVDAAGLRSGGISLWDVTNPASPQPLAQNVGDVTVDAAGTEDEVTFTHTYHSALGWRDGGNTYLVGVDNDDLDGFDIDIWDITDPANPMFLIETGLPNFPQAEQDPPPNGNTPFFHDVTVKEVGGEMLMLASYWDAGYVILNVDDPARPVYLRDTTFAGTEPFSAELGLPQGIDEGLVPEGNAHQAEFSSDNRLFLAADEDFDAYRVLGEITSGASAGITFTGTQGSGVPQVAGDDTITGATTFVGLACDADGPLQVAAESSTALVERGVCNFTEKIQNVQEAGYGSVLVFNSAVPDCLTLVNMVAEADIPALFINRDIGLHLLDVDGDDPCTAVAPSAGSPTADISIEAVFDGWGYVHLFDTLTMEELDRYAISESLDPAFAEGFGDLSVHEVAMDPGRNRAYVSYYSGGFRVVDFDETGMREVGVYIDDEGNNFWGVQVHEVGGEQYVLASDRDSGLWIFQYSP